MQVLWLPPGASRDPRVSPVSAEGGAGAGSRRAPPQGFPGSGTRLPTAARRGAGPLGSGSQRREGCRRHQEMRARLEGADAAPGPTGSPQTHSTEAQTEDRRGAVPGPRSQRPRGAAASRQRGAESRAVYLTSPLCLPARRLDRNV